MFQASWDTLVFLNEVRRKLMDLPVRLSLPKHFSEISLPRYYAIYLTSLENFEVVDIVGVKRNNRPTTWSYRFGYWHPCCAISIVRAIVREESEIEKELKKGEAE